MDNVFEPKYLDIEYFFLLIYRLIKFLPDAILRSVRWLKESNFESVSLIISLIFLFACFIVIIKTTTLKKKAPEPAIDLFPVEIEEDNRASRWDAVKNRLDSESQEEWKRAVIEADGLVDEIMAKIGYEGKTLGEKLMMVEPSDFDNLKNVWEANKFKNRIVKEGIGFEISKEDVKSALEKYEKALKELKYL